MANIDLHPSPQVKRQWFQNILFVCNDGMNFRLSYFVVTLWYDFIDCRMGYLCASEQEEKWKLQQKVI